MSQNTIETAHHNINKKKFDAGYDAIDWTLSWKKADEVRAEQPPESNGENVAVDYHDYECHTEYDPRLTLQNNSYEITEDNRNLPTMLSDISETLSYGPDGTAHLLDGRRGTVKVLITFEPKE